MLGRFTAKTWLAIGGAVVAVAIAAVLVAGLTADDDDGGEVCHRDHGQHFQHHDQTDDHGPRDDVDDRGVGRGRGTTPCPGLSPPGEVLGETDLDGDDVDELFVRTASGVRDTIALFRVDECEAVSVTLDSAPAEFAVGASVTATGGLQCGEGRAARSGSTRAKAPTARITASRGGIYGSPARRSPRWPPAGRPPMSATSW